MNALPSIFLKLIILAKVEQAKIKKSIILLLLLGFFCVIPLPAFASYCRDYRGNTICILSIKRSAKYHWEYRASVRINGIKRPIEIYDCRHHIRVHKDGTAIPFEHNGAGELICNVLKR